MLRGTRGIVDSVYCAFGSGILGPARNFREQRLTGGGGGDYIVRRLTRLTGTDRNAFEERGDELAWILIDVPMAGNAAEKASDGLSRLIQMALIDDAFALVGKRRSQRIAGA